MKSTGIFIAQAAPRDSTSHDSGQRVAVTMSTSVRNLGCRIHVLMLSVCVDGVGCSYLRAGGLSDDGSSSSATSIGRFSGSSVPSDVTASGSRMHIGFHTDSSVTNEGFHSEWHCVSPPPPPSPPPPTCHTCNGQQSTPGTIHNSQGLRTSVLTSYGKVFKKQTCLSRCLKFIWTFKRLQLERLLLAPALFVGARAPTFHFVLDGA
jgi:hypothetical protein